jgi:predicted phosphodiesterase
MHIPEHDKRALGTAIKIAKWYSPDEVIILGDFLDCGAVSHWNRTKIKDREGLRLAKDFTVGNEVLDSIQKFCPKITYLEGNHEFWVRDLITEQPELEGLIDVEVGLRLKERGIKFLPYNTRYQLGKLSFTHGLYTCQAHAKKHVQEFGCSIVYGHLHDVQLHIRCSPIDVDDKHLGLSLGCLAKKNPQFMRNRPSNWVHAVGVGTVRQDGCFNIDPVIISAGTASYAGRTFRA